MFLYFCGRLNILDTRFLLHFFLYLCCWGFCLYFLLHNTTSITYNWISGHDFFYGLLNLTRLHLSSTVKGFRNNRFISKTQIDNNVSPSFLCVVRAPPVSTVQIVVPLEPLYELKIILVLGFRQFLYLNISFNSCLIECSLQYFKVVYKLVLIFCFPIYLAHGNLSGMNNINNLTVDWSSA